MPDQNQANSVNEAPASWEHQDAEVATDGTASRQSLSYRQRERAARAQIIGSRRQGITYNVPFGRAPDEQPYNDEDPSRGGFPRCNWSGPQVAVL